MGSASLIKCRCESNGPRPHTNCCKAALQNSGVRWLGRSCVRLACAMVRSSRAVHRNTQGNNTPTTWQASRDSRALRVENLEFGKEGGLRFYLAALADDHDLHIRGIEVGARRGDHIRRSK